MNSLLHFQEIHTTNLQLQTRKLLHNLHPETRKPEKSEMEIDEIPQATRQAIFSNFLFFIAALNETKSRGLLYASGRVKTTFDLEIFAMFPEFEKRWLLILCRNLKHKPTSLWENLHLLDELFLAFKQGHEAQWPDWPGHLQSEINSTRERAAALEYIEENRTRERPSFSTGFVSEHEYDEVSDLYGLLREGRPDLGRDEVFSIISSTIDEYEEECQRMLESQNTSHNSSADSSPDANSNNKSEELREACI